MNLLEALRAVLSKADDMGIPADEVAKTLEKLLEDYEMKTTPPWDIIDAEDQDGA